MPAIIGFEDNEYSLTSRQIYSTSLLKVGTGAIPIKAIRRGSFTITPNNGSAISTYAEQNQTISGLSVGDIVLLDISGVPAPYVSFERSYVSLQDTLTIVWRNLHHSSSTVDSLSYADSSVKTITYLWFDLT